MVKESEIGKRIGGEYDIRQNVQTIGREKTDKQLSKQIDKQMKIQTNRWRKHGGTLFICCSDRQTDRKPDNFASIIVKTSRNLLTHHSLQNIHSFYQTQLKSRSSTTKSSSIIALPSSNYYHTELLISFPYIDLEQNLWRSKVIDANRLREIHIILYNTYNMPTPIMLMCPF